MGLRDRNECRIRGMPYEFRGGGVNTFFESEEWEND